MLCESGKNVKNSNFTLMVENIKGLPEQICTVWNIVVRDKMDK